MEEHRLGALLLENPVMRQEDLERCLEIQALTGGTRPLGQILVDEGVITQSALDELLTAQAERVGAAGSALSFDGEEANDILAAAIELGANELVLSEGREPMVRVAGQLYPVAATALQAKDIWDFAHEFMDPGLLASLAERQSVTEGFAIPDVARGRVTAFRHFDGICVMLRLHPPEVRAASQLGLDSRLAAAVQQEKGFVLVIGDAASGVSETLNSLLLEATHAGQRQFLVLDEDLEAPPPAGSSTVVRRAVGRHVRSYADGLRSAVALDPDAIFVGDVTSPESFDLALRAAEGGRLVVAGLRARSVLEGIRRVMSFYPERDAQAVQSTLASVLSVMVALHLLPEADELGQALASELLVVDDSVREVLREGAMGQISLLMRLSGQTLDHSLIGLVESQRVRFEDAFVHAEDKQMMLREGRAR